MKKYRLRLEWTAGFHDDVEARESSEILMQSLKVVQRVQDGSVVAELHEILEATQPRPVRLRSNQ